MSGSAPANYVNCVQRWSNDIHLNGDAPANYSSCVV